MDNRTADIRHVMRNNGALSKKSILNKSKPVFSNETIISIPVRRCEVLIVDNGIATYRHDYVHDGYIPKALSSGKSLPYGDKVNKIELKGKEKTKWKNKDKLAEFNAKKKQKKAYFASLQTMIIEYSKRQYTGLSEDAYKALCAKLCQCETLEQFRNILFSISSYDSELFYKIVAHFMRIDAKRTEYYFSSAMLDNSGLIYGFIEDWKEYKEELELWKAARNKRKAKIEKENSARLEYDRLEKLKEKQQNEIDRARYNPDGKLYDSVFGEFIDIESEKLDNSSLVVMNKNGFYKKVQRIFIGNGMICGIDKKELKPRL